MLVLSNEEIEQIITMPECMAVLEELYRDLAEGRALISPRMDNLSPTGREGAYYTFKHMGGTWPRRKLQALRINSDVITHPVIGGSIRREKVPLAGGRWVGLVELFSTETGELLAVFPDGVAQRMRVGATNGLGVKYLARKDAKRAALIGTGWQAGSQLMALLAARPMEEVKVFSVRRESREAFVAEWQKKFPAVRLRAVDTPEECARDVEIILAATSSLVPVIRPEWLREGMHASCIKAQEVNGPVVARCQRVVVNTKIQAKELNNIMPGTPNIPEEHIDGWWKQKGMRWQDFPELSELVAGKFPGRAGDQEITCFVNNVGLGLQFAGVGAVILDKARQLGIGHDLPGEWFTESVHP